MLQSLRQKAQDRLFEWLLPLIGTALATVLLTAESYLAPLLSDKTGLIVLRVSAALVLVSFLGLAAFFWFRPKFKTPPQFGGASQNIKTGELFCTSCLITDKIKSPLLAQDHGWRCVIKGCGSFYHNPNYKEPKPRPINYDNRGIV